MRHEAAGFYRKKEIIRRRLSPLFHRLLRRKAIKHIVEFHGVEELRVQRQPLPSRALCWVEGGSPVLVMPTGGADVDGTFGARADHLAEVSLPRHTALMATIAAHP